MDLNLEDSLEQQVVDEDWRVMFHGTCRRFEAFNEGSIGQGGDHNSALGVHFAEFPDSAAEYAEAGMRGGEGEPTVLIVLVPAINGFEERDYYTFFGFNEDGNPDPGFGHAGFAHWRQQLLAQGHDVVDFEDGEGCITVALDPSVLQIVGRMDVDEAMTLRERMDELEDAFDPAQRIALLRQTAAPAARSARRPGA